jgi:hypothetical protein
LRAFCTAGSSSTTRIRPGVRAEVIASDDRASDDRAALTGITVCPIKLSSLDSVPSLPTIAVGWFCLQQSEAYIVFVHFQRIGKPLTIFLHLYLLEIHPAAMGLLRKKRRLVEERRFSAA